MAKQNQPSKEKVRITLDLSPQLYKRLGKLEQLVDAESKSNLIRSALQLYEYIAKRSVEGCTFRIVDGNGKEEQLVFFGPVPTGEGQE